MFVYVCVGVKTTAWVYDAGYWLNINKNTTATRQTVYFLSVPPHLTIFKCNFQTPLPDNFLYSKIKKKKKKKNVKIKENFISCLSFSPFLSSYPILCRFLLS